MLTRFTRFAVGMAVVAFAVAASPAHAAAIVSNPSFEANGNFSGWGWDDSKPITGWTKGGIEFSSGTYLAGVLSPVAQAAVFDNGKSLDGSQTGHVAEVQVYDTVYRSTLSTTVSDLEIGKQYQLSFYENARTGYSPVDCSVTLDGVAIVASHSVSSVDLTGSYSNLFNQVVSPAFTATATSETLTFINQKESSNKSLDAVWLFDNVSVTQVVPEPSFFVIAFTGLLGLMAYAWRRPRS